MIKWIVPSAGVKHGQNMNTSLVWLIFMFFAQTTPTCDQSVQTQLLSEKSMMKLGQHTVIVSHASHLQTLEQL